MVKEIFTMIGISLLTTFYVCADDNEIDAQFESSLSETKSLLPTTVHNVSVLSGEWVDAETDFYIEGPEPLSLTRCYGSGYEPPLKFPKTEKEMDYRAENPCPISDFHCGSSWFFNRPCRLNLEGPKGYLFLSSGMRSSFRKSNEDTDQPATIALILDETKGLTNCMSAEISARTNPHNVILYYNEKNHHCSAVTGAGHIAHFSKTHHFAPADFEQKPSGNYIVREKNSLSSMNPKNNLCYGKLTFQTEGETVKVLSSDGQEALYKFAIKLPTDDLIQARNLKESAKEKEYREDKSSEPTRGREKTTAEIEKERQAHREYFLKEIHFTHKPEEKFEYTDTGKLKAIHYPNHRSVALSYTGKRIRALKGPIGTDPDPVTLYSFNYKINKIDDWRQEGCVTVLDALQNKTEYIQNKERRLIAHKKYLGKGKQTQSLYCSETYVWDDESIDSPYLDLVRPRIAVPPLPPIYPGKQIKNLPHHPKIIPPQPQPTPNPEKPIQEEKKEKVRESKKRSYTISELIHLALEAKAKRAEKRLKASQAAETIKQKIQDLAKAKDPRETLKNYLEAFYPTLKDYVQNAYTPGQGNLLGKYIQDGQGHIQLARFFDYDEDGNILLDTTYGNLTGRQTHSMQLKSGEHYSKHFAYSDDGLNLLLMEKEDSGKSLLYFYYPETDLPAAKILRDHEQILMREFYEYDDNAVLIKKIRDNGTGLEKEDLTQVTERRITYITPTTQAPLGLPETLVETYLENGQEQILSSTHCKYSLSGKLIQKDCFDAQGNYHSTCKWDYDAHGNLIQETDPLGKITLKKYDENDNLSWEQGPHYTKEYIYDFANRLIALKETRDNETFSTSYEYDALGNRLSLTDRSGNQTRFEYDELNRLTKTLYPPVLNEDGKVVQYTSTTDYDIFNHPTVVKNGRGYSTTTSYNAYGKPIRIEYPDQTTEQFEYNLNGTVFKSIAKNGTITEYTRDSLGRILIEEVYTPSYEKLSKKTFTYKGARLISSTDPLGCVTHFTYDGAGRLIETKSADHKKTIQYNPQGQVAKTIEHGRIETFVYDLLGRVLEEKVENTEGQILRKVVYSYDVDGNRKTITEETAAGPSKTRTQYNAEKKPLQITDALGHTTHIHYDYYYHEYGINLLKITTTDPVGKTAVQLYDALGRLVKNHTNNAYGVLLTQQHLFYDAAGNLIRTTDLVLEDQREITTLFDYNSMNAPTSLIEALGTPEQKITYTSYNALGQKETIIKPDRTQLHHTYDALGRLQHLHSSDGTISYYYTYNANHQVTKVTDSIYHTETIRQYDLQGQLQLEKLSNDLTLKYTYDAAQQLTNIELPDNTSIEYTYDAAFLKGVHRIKNKQKVYSHLYQKHDQAGNLLQSQTISSSQVQYNYDLLKRPVQITTLNWSQTMPQGAYDPLGRLTHYETKDVKGKTPYHFNYNDRNSLILEKGHQTHTYTADSLHNRTSKNGQTCQLNDLNQLISYGNNLYKYDKNGNLIQKNSILFGYDALDRMTSVTKNGLTTHYQYDAFNRRVAKIQNGKDQKYLYQGQDEIGSADEKNQIQELRVLGKGIEAEIGAGVAFELYNEVYEPSYDHHGNVMCLSTSQGLYETYRYTAFGEEQLFNAQGQEKSHSKNPWRYSSKRLDPETGFVYFGRRYYDPDSGRWVTADPAGYADGPNLYAYLHHSPLTSHDAYGLYDEQNSNSASFCISIQGVKDCGEKTSPAEQIPESKLPYFDLFTKLVGDQSRIGDLGIPEKDHFFVSLANGMKTSFNDTKKLAQYLSENFAYGNNITFAHNDTGGWIVDGVECILGICGIATEPVRLQKRVWDIGFAHLEPNEFILHYATSQGCIITNLALQDYPQELRERIIIVAIAPGEYIKKELCHSVKHFEAYPWRDMVPHLVNGMKAVVKQNPMQLLNVPSNVHFLKSHPDAPWHDHSMMSPTFSQPLRQNTQKYYLGG